MKAKLKYIIPTAISVIVIVLAFVFIRFTPNTADNITSMLSTAQKYLVEQNYEQAIIEFNKIIELDPMNADAYLGLAQAYENSGDIENAVAALEKGYELTGDERLKAVLSDLLAVSQPQITDGIYIPEIDGMSKEELETLFTELGLKFKIGEQYHNEIPAGQIISHNIPKDRIMKPDKRLNVIISKGVEAKTVGNYIGKMYNLAENEIKKQNLTIKFILEYNDEFEQGIVIAQQPAAGTQAVLYSPVILTCSRGREITEAYLVAHIDTNTTDKAESAFSFEYDEKGRLIAQYDYWGESTEWLRRHSYSYTEKENGIINITAKTEIKQSDNNDFVLIEEESHQYEYNTETMIVTYLDDIEYKKAGQQAFGFALGHTVSETGDDYTDPDIACNAHYSYVYIVCENSHYMNINQFLLNT